MDLKEKKLSSAEIFKGKMLKLYVDTVVCPNGNEATRELIKDCRASVILPILPNGKILFEKQYRYPVDEIITELPAGKCDKKEDPEATAIRELEEETGYKANKITYLGKFYPAIGYSDETIYCYLAEDLVKTKQNLDENEFVEIIELSIDEYLELFKEGKILDAKTIISMNLYLNKR